MMSENIRECNYLIYEIFHWHNSMHNKLVEYDKCEEKNFDTKIDVKHD